MRLLVTRERNPMLAIDDDCERKAGLYDVLRHHRPRRTFEVVVERSRDVERRNDGHQSVRERVHSWVAVAVDRAPPCRDRTRSEIRDVLIGAAERDLGIDVRENAIA